MIKIRFILTLRLRSVQAFSLLTLLLASCAPSVSSPTLEGTEGEVNLAMTQAIETAFAQINQPTATPAITDTPVPTAIVPRTPPALPAFFQTAGLDPAATPHTYLTDSCQYIKAKWDSNNAAPGTIVMVIMFHTIEKATETAADPKNVGSGDFKRLMKNLHDLGFQAINATQLADFLDGNAKIPPRSVVLIQDDRHAAENFNDWFRPYWQEWGWPVVNAWISGQGGSDPVLAENVALEQEGWVDHQAHGFVHNINMSDGSTDEFLLGELQGPMDVFQQYYGKKPVAIIWPGGGFGVRPVQAARQLGYRIGFTVNPRGPIMFNWVPLADQASGTFDIAEGPVGDPRMTLPRYWPTQVIQNLDTVRVISEQAAAYAEQNKAIELEYYDIVCAPTYGAIP